MPINTYTYIYTTERILSGLYLDICGVGISSMAVIATSWGKEHNDGTCERTPVTCVNKIVAYMRLQKQFQCP